MDAKKTKGRFIKKNENLSKIVNISNFSFEDISHTKLTWPDNAKANVFHKRLHTEQTLNAGVRIATDFVKQFEPNSQNNIMKPVDFTSDWRRMKNRFHGSKNKLDEDDIEIELEYLENQKRSAMMSSIKEETNEQNKNPEQENNPESHDTYHDEQVIASDTDEQEEPTRLNNIKIKKSGQISQEKFIPNTPSENHLDKLIASVDIQDHAEQEKQIVTTADNMKQNYAPSARQEKDEIGTEFRSLSTYFNSSAVQSLSENEQQLIEGAKSRGYEDGFKLGEEKATIQVRQTLSHAKSALEKIYSELHSLKKNVMVNSNDNFLMLSKALIESILKKEFTINPSSFAALIERAIKDAVPDDTFSIFVSPSITQSLKNVVDEPLRSKIFSDQNIEDGNFRIDSKLTVVDAKISELIEDLLENIDVTTIHSLEKAG